MNSPAHLLRSFQQGYRSEIIKKEAKEITKTIDFARRLARTNEALVAIEPERNNRAAAGFVAATAYQLVYQATELHESNQPDAFIKADGISSDISAMLLFLVADATADASEVARSIKIPKEDPLQLELIQHLIMLAEGHVGRIVELKRPPQKELVRGENGERVNAALYYHILRGIRALAFALQGRSVRGMKDPIAVFFRSKKI
ncbi:hypothetical protein OS12_31330 [Dickeya oryzae]